MSLVLSSHISRPLRPASFFIATSLLTHPTLGFFPSSNHMSPSTDASHHGNASTSSRTFTSLELCYFSTARANIMPDFPKKFRNTNTSSDDIPSVHLTGLDIG
jgi:hypothetical protein